MTTDWRTRAACRGMDPELFFPTSGPGTPDALAACRRCPVALDCREDADSETRYKVTGIWAGERRRENGRTHGNGHPPHIRQAALELWREHRRNYSNDQSAAKAVAAAVAKRFPDDEKPPTPATILTWARVAGLARQPWARSTDPAKRYAALAEYHRTRHTYLTESAARAEIAAKHGVSRTTIRNWLRNNPAAKATEAA